MSPLIHKAAHAALCAAFLLSMGLTQAQTAPTDPSAHGTAGTPAAPAAASTPDLSEGEVVRWDATTAKVTLRHGPIQNLEMPPMTMVFRVTDPAQAAQTIKPGAKVRFRAEQQNGAYVVTRIEAVAN